ncbi:MAG: GNAT family N-acetyltransferase [Pseudomonadota bacterium]
MSVTLRDAGPDDFALCRELLAELQSATGGAQSDNMAAVFADLVSQQRGRIILAEDSTDGAAQAQTLGLAAVSFNRAMRFGGEYCQLAELVVTPAARGKRVGVLLMQAVIDNARARGCAEIGLYLLASTAHNEPFYNKFGFQTIGEEMRLTL